MTLILEPEKAVLDFDSKLEQSSIETDKKTESAIVVTKFKALYYEGMFSDYSKPLEKIAKMGSWVGMRMGPQEGLWTMKIVDKDGTVIVTMPKCTLQDINLSYAKEDIIVGIKIQHEMSIEQPALEAAVSTAVRLRLIKDEAAFDTPLEEI